MNAISKSGGLLLAAAGVVSLATSEVRADDAHNAAPVGLSLFFRDGAAPPVHPVGASPRYLQELDIVATITTPTDQGVAPLVTGGDLAGLDWRGIAFIEEDWRLAADGTFTRQRF